MKTHLIISEEILNNTFKCKKGFSCLSGEWKDLCQVIYYNHKTFDLLGVLMIIGAFFGIGVHGLIRIIAYKKNGGKNCKENGVEK